MPRRKARKSSRKPAIVEEQRVLKIPLNRIRPMPGQPREYFDQEALGQLKASIGTIGQLVPIIVRELDDGEPEDYEIVDGQRRWIAHQMLCEDGLRTKYGGKDFSSIRATVIKVASKDDQFLRSAVANLGRAEHTILEEARAVGRLKGKVIDGVTMGAEEIADAFGRSRAWVYQRLGILRLDESVQRTLDPSQPRELRLTFSQALFISTFPPDLQRQVAHRAIARGLTLNETRAYGRQLAAERGLQIKTSGGRKRKPSDDHKNLRRFVTKILRDADAMIGLPLQDLLVTRSERQIEELLRDIDIARGKMHVLREALGKARPKRKSSDNGKERASRYRGDDVSLESLFDNRDDDIAAAEDLAGTMEDDWD